MYPVTPVTRTSPRSLRDSGAAAVAPAVAGSAWGVVSRAVSGAVLVGGSAGMQPVCATVAGVARPSVMMGP